MRNVGSEEHTLAGLQDHVIHQINAPAAHVAGEVTGYTQKKSRQQLVLSFTSQRSDTLLEPLKRRGDLVIGASHQRREARLQSLLFLGLRLGLGQQLARISPKDAGKLFNFFNKKFYFMKRAETTQCLKWPQPSCHHFWLVVWVFVEVRTGSVQFFSMFLNQT